MENLVNDIIAANQRIKAVDGGVRQTPLDESGIFSDQTGVSFLLKGEHLQRTGSFKMRGAMNKVLCLKEEDRKRGIITASSGNHGMATTQAARVGGVAATIYLPESVSPLKHANMKRSGTNTVLVPGNGLEAEKAARAAAEREGKTYVSPYSDLDIIAGQGTVGLELAEKCPDLAAVYVCVGGGGLISGIGCFLKAHRPDVEIIGCWPENAAAMHLCIEKGEIYDTPAGASRESLTSNPRVREQPGSKPEVSDGRGNVCSWGQRCYEAEGCGLMLLRLFQQRSEGAV